MGGGQSVDALFRISALADGEGTGLSPAIRVDHADFRLRCRVAAEADEKIAAQGHRNRAPVHFHDGTRGGVTDDQAALLDGTLEAEVVGGGGNKGGKAEQEDPKNDA